MKKNRFLVVAICLSTSVIAREVEPSPRVKLVVLVVVDQMRGDYLPRFAPHLGEGGFARLMKEGADFRNAYMSYGCTATGPGHATLSTGRMPRQHGIPGNEWYLEEGSDKPQQPIDDPNCKVLGVDDERPRGLSSWRLMGPGFADALKLADRRSRVFSVGMKDRAVIFLGGKNPDAAIWWDVKTGRFVSSTYYMQKLPDYVETFNKERWPDRFVGKVWEKLLPDEAYADCYPTDPAWITEDDGLGRAFPHEMPAVQGKPDRKFYAALYCCPFGDDIVLEMAKRVLSGEKLGKGAATDLLCVAFSANDTCGHVFGPESAEMKDMTLRTDRQLAELIAALDVQVGRGGYLLAVTADHGVKSIPDLAMQLRLGGGRLDGKAIISDLNAALVQAFGKPTLGSRYVDGIEWPWVYFDRALEKMAPAALKRLLDSAASQLRAMPGVDDVFTMDEMAGPAPSLEERDRLMAWRSYNSHTCGQLYVQLSPYWHVISDKTTGHCTSHTHDRHIPILLYGPGIRPGTYYSPADGVDIVVTLSALLGIEKPLDAVGRVLDEAIR